MKKNKKEIQPKDKRPDHILMQVPLSDMGIPLTGAQIIERMSKALKKEKSKKK